MTDDLQEENSWPARDFDLGARAYLLEESRKRVQEQLAHIGAQDVKAAALFTASAVLFTATGLVGDLKIEPTASAVLTCFAFFASVVSWLLLGCSYWTREVGVGVNLQILRDHYVDASEQELRDSALESAVEDFELNQRTIKSKARWLRFAFMAIAIQLALVFASVMASSLDSTVETETQESPVAEEVQSGAPSLDSSR